MALSTAGTTIFFKITVEIGRMVTMLEAGNTTATLVSLALVGHSKIHCVHKTGNPRHKVARVTAYLEPVEAPTFLTTSH